MPEAVFKSTHPDVLAAVKERDAAEDEWVEKVNALSREAFGRKVKFYTQGDRLVGFKHKPVPGWKYRADSEDVLVPDGRTSIGRKFSKKIKEIRHPRQVECPGMPQMSMDHSPAMRDGGVIIRYPAWGEMNGVVWCRWGSYPDLDEVDSTMWERAKLSEFHLAAESVGAKV